MVILSILFKTANMIKIGIDPSINCTGICVWDTEREENATISTYLCENRTLF